MNKFSLDGYNDEQKQALLSLEGHVLVTAGAGSGKTRLLTGRIAYLIQEKNVSPYEILAITFTNKAANEMKERVSKETGFSNEIWISTFHSLCVRILRREADALGEPYSKNFSIYSESDTEKTLKKIFTERNITDDKIKKAAAFHISNLKGKNIDRESYRNEFQVVRDIDEILKIYDLYQAELRKNNALDFDDLLSKTCELLTCRPDICEKYARRFKYVLVDEFQDTNEIQFQLSRLLSSFHGNLFVVGDEDQSIYSWRGANYRNIMNFSKMFPDTRVFKLQRNYRSTKTILSLANRVIKNNSSRLEKTLWTEKGDGSEPEMFVSGDEQNEAEYIARKIKALVSSGEYGFGDIAVLTRLNALSLPFEEKFLNYGIPYRMFGGFKFFERVEIKNIISYLRLFSNPTDELSFLRVINFPKRGLGDGAIRKLKEISSANNTTLLDMCVSLSNEKQSNSVFQKFSDFGKTYSELLSELGKLNLYEFVEKVIKKFAIYSAFDRTNETERDKILNIDSFLVSLETQTEKNPELTLEDYLESVALVSDIDTMEDGDNNVKIATIHSVKGLEFPVVFIVGLEESIFPIIRPDSKADDIEEERRLVYVAITRAEEKLFLTRAKTRFLYGKREYMIPSRFLGELGMENREPLFSSSPKTFEKTEQNGYNCFQAQKSYQPFGKSFSSFVSSKPEILQKQATTISPKKDISGFRSGQSVEHTKFGRGVIKSISVLDKCADIEFEDFGVKTLLLEIAPLEIINEEENI